MSENFRKGWHKDNSNEYYVDSEPINNICKKSNISYIDLMTIDVEGGEQVVLETIDFNIPIYIICIELDNHNIDKDNNCRKILKKNGFILHLCTFKTPILFLLFIVNKKMLIYYINNE